MNSIPPVSSSTIRSPLLRSGVQAAVRLGANEKNFVTQSSPITELVVQKRLRRSPDDDPVPLMTPTQLRESLSREGLGSLFQPASPDASGKEPEVFITSNLERVLACYAHLPPKSTDRIYAGAVLRAHIQSDAFPVELRKSETFREIQAQVDMDIERLKQPVEPNLHWIWIGSLTEQVKANIRIFLSSNAAISSLENKSPNLSFYLAYDSCGYLAHELNSAIQRVGKATVNNVLLINRELQYQKRVIELQNEAYARIRISRSPEEYNQEAINFMVERLGENRKRLEQKVLEAQASFVNFQRDLEKEYGKNKVLLIDLNTLINKEHPLRVPYLQEIWLRGNLPAAADIGRSVLLHEYGGTYADADVSPLLQEEIFDKKVSELEEEILTLVEKYSPPVHRAGSLGFWKIKMEASRLQAVHNFIAARDRAWTPLAGEDVFSVLRQNIFATRIPTISRLVVLYLSEIKSAPTRYAHRRPQMPLIHKFFKPFHQPGVLPTGLAMQIRPNAPVGFDISILHGKKNSPVFRRYWSIVANRYRELDVGGVTWDREIPDSLNNNPKLRQSRHGYYRLDGLADESVTTGTTTGPHVFAQAAMDVAPPIQNESLKWSWGTLPSFTRDVSKEGCILLPFFTARTALQLETPEDAKSAWRGDDLPANFDFSQKSKYDRQIVLQLDDALDSAKVSRYFNNRHSNSLWLQLAADSEFRRLDGAPVSRLGAEEWGDATRIILVGSPAEARDTIGGHTAADVARLIQRIVPAEPTAKAVARIKVVSWSRDAEKMNLSSASDDFCAKLLNLLQDPKTKSIKGYSGPIEVDVWGRTWVTQPQTGVREHKSPTLRFVVEIENQRVVTRPVAVDEDDTDVIPRAPAYSVGAERRAVVLIAPEAALRTNAMNEFRQAVESLRRRHPMTEVYALSDGENGQFQQWEFDPRAANWSEGWRALRNFFQGTFEKVILLGHGDAEVGLIGGREYQIIAEATARLLRGVHRVEHLSLLACGNKPQVGVRIAQEFSKKQIAIGRITGSELKVYVFGDGLQEGTSAAPDIRPGSRIYERNGKLLRHGTPHAKWEVIPDSMGKTQIISYFLASHGDGKIVNDRHGLAGPFDYAWRRQELAKVRRNVHEAMEVIASVTAEIEEKAAEDFNRSGKWTAVIDQIKREQGRSFVPVVEQVSGRIKKIWLSEEKAQAISAAQRRLMPGYEKLRSQFEITNEGRLKLKPTNMGDGKLNNQNTAFFAMALIEYLQARKTSGGTELSVYWNLGGMGVAVAGDGVELGKLISQLASSARAGQSLQAIEQIFKMANMGFLLGSVGGDIYQLATESDPVKRVGDAIRLGFTSGALALQGGTATLGAFAFAETASVFGELSGPLLALGFGFSALGMQIKQNNIEVHGLLKYFSAFASACQQGGFLETSGRLLPNPAAVITKIDFETQKIEFGSPQVLKSKRAQGTIQTLSGAVPQFIYTPGKGHEYFGLLEELEIDKVAKLKDAAEIVLPSTSNMDILYDYTYSAAALDKGEKEIVKKLEARGNFVASNSWGDLRAAFRNSQPTYRETLINVNLGRSTRICWFNPIIPRTVSYEIIGKGGQYALRGLHAGVRLTRVQEPTRCS